MSHRWTTVQDLVTVARKRWNTGRYLRAHAAGTAWEPVILPVKGPTAPEFLDHFDEAVRWAERFQRDSHTAGGRPRFAVEFRIVKGRSLGANSVPARIRLDSFEQLCLLLGTSEDLRTLDALIAHTSTVMPALVGWVADNPMVSIEHQTVWPELLSVVDWIAEHDSVSLYLRHIDVPGADTKFVEHHRKLLDKLLMVVLPEERIDRSQTGFVRRFRFRSKPAYTRFRLLSPQPTFPPQLTELRLRTDELAGLALPVRTVFVVENETTYLAFPEVPDSIAIFGEGFALTTLEGLPWLPEREIVYWGDIDTHGFVMLDRLRTRVVSVRSILMDHDTLLAHPNQQVVEPNPTSEQLVHLTDAEQSLYSDLIEDRFGRSIRLEQERVRFSYVRAALQPWTTRAPMKLG